MIRFFILFEAASFFTAALIHSGFLVTGYEHSRARVAESVIGAVLVGGVLLTWVRPTLLRSVGIAVQGFALLGTLVGVFTIVVGVGPRTVPDVIYHVAIIAVLLVGLRATMR